MTARDIPPIPNYRPSATVYDKRHDKQPTYNADGVSQADLREHVPTIPVVIEKVIQAGCDLTEDEELVADQYLEEAKRRVFELHLAKMRKRKT